MAYEIGGRADKYGNRFELMLKSKHMCLANTDLRFHLSILLRQRKKPEYMREKTTMPVSVRGANCPKEKEDAIMDAFRHFNMI